LTKTFIVSFAICVQAVVLTPTCSNNPRQNHDKRRGNMKINPKDMIIYFHIF